MSVEKHQSIDDEKHLIGAGAATAAVPVDAKYIDEDERRLNELGHVQALDRHFGLLSICSLGLVSTNSWAAVSSVFALGIYYGGLPGIFWGFIVVAVPNFFVGLSLAELSSSYPVAGGVYHWAAVIADESWAPIASFLTAYLNIAAWILGVASISATLGQEINAIANMINPSIDVVNWRIFVIFIAFNTATAFGATVFNRFLPAMNRTALVYTICACLIIAITCVSKASPHATGKEVFVTFNNESGYGSMGLAFLIGLVNPNYGFTSLDTIIHLSEELPSPSKNIPKGIMACVVCGFLSCTPFLICLFFSVSNLDAVLETTTGFPLGEIFRQATGQAGGVALLIIFTIANVPALPNTQLSTSRLVWAVARDGGLPFSKFFAHIHPTFKVPLNAQILVWFLATCLGAIYMGSTFAFNCLIGSSLIVNYLAWGIPILANVLQRRKAFERGPYSMGDKLGFTANIISLCWIALTTVLWCFPYSLPIEAAETMNYSCVVVGGIIILTLCWWFIGGHKTFRPPVHQSAHDVQMRLAREAELVGAKKE